MVTSNAGKDFIKGFEGCSLTPYKLAGEYFYTVGYGHYGVTSPAKITKKQADDLFNSDIKKFEAAVNKYVLKLSLNQNEYDALVSFAFNCGIGNLTKLVDGRTKKQIAEKITLYTKDSRGITLQGLVNRRKAEKELFLKPDNNKKIIKFTESSTLGEVVDAVLNGQFGNDTARKDAIYKLVQDMVNKRVK